jgi:hypothetical protein
MNWGGGGTEAGEKGEGGGGFANQRGPGYPSTETSTLYCIPRDALTSNLLCA